jgi:hypothetical protein
MGFALPARITAAAVRSYRTFSPLPAWGYQTGGIVFCGTFRKTRFERAPPAVSRHAALWRPDFPPQNEPIGTSWSDCPSGRPAPIMVCSRPEPQPPRRKPHVTVKHPRKVAYLQSVGVFCQQRTFFKGVQSDRVRQGSLKVLKLLKAVVAIDGRRVASRVSAAPKGVGCC